MSSKRPEPAPIMCWGDVEELLRLRDKAIRRLHGLSYKWSEAALRRVDMEEQKQPRPPKPVGRFPTVYCPQRSRIRAEGALSAKRARARGTSLAKFCEERRLPARLNVILDWCSAVKEWSSWRIWSSLYDAAPDRPAWLVPYVDIEGNPLLGRCYVSRTANYMTQGLGAWTYTRVRADVVAAALRAWGFEVELRPYHVRTHGYDEAGHPAHTVRKPGPPRSSDEDWGGAIEVWANIPPGIRWLVPGQIESLYRKHHRQELRAVTGPWNLKVLYGPNEPD